MLLNKIMAYPQFISDSCLASTGIGTLRFFDTHLKADAMVMVSEEGHFSAGVGLKYNFQKQFKI